MSLLVSLVPADDPAPSAVDNPVAGARFAMAALPAGSARRTNVNFGELLPVGQDASVHLAYRYVQGVMSACGYSEMGWYPMVKQPDTVGLVPAEGITAGELLGVGGFTKVEQYGEDGKPLEGSVRWSKDLPPNGISSVSDFFELLLHGAKPGRYRAFYLAITEYAPVQRTLDAPAIEVLTHMRIEGLRDINASWDRFNKWTDPRLTAIVYEFEKSAADGAVRFHQDSNHGIDFHLRGSGLIALFEP